MIITFSTGETHIFNEEELDEQTRFNKEKSLLLGVFDRVVGQTLQTKSKEYQEDPFAPWHEVAREIKYIVDHLSEGDRRQLMCIMFMDLVMEYQQRPRPR